MSKQKLEQMTAEDNVVDNSVVEQLKVEINQLRCIVQQLRRSNDIFRTTVRGQALIVSNLMVEKMDCEEELEKCKTLLLLAGINIPVTKNTPNVSK